MLKYNNFLFAEDTIIYVENAEESTKHCHINKGVSHGPHDRRYNIHMAITYLYMNTEQSEFEIF